MVTFFSRQGFGRRWSWCVPKYFSGIRLEKLRIAAKIQFRIVPNVPNLRTAYLLNTSAVVLSGHCSPLLGVHRQELSYRPKHHVFTGLMCLAYISPRISRRLSVVMTSAETGQVPTCCAIFLGLVRFEVLKELSM